LHKRRHDDTQQRLDHAKRLAESKPGISARQIAKEAGVSPTTAAKIVKTVEQSGDVSIVDTSSTRTDTKGREQPAGKPARKPKPQPTQPRQSAAQRRDEAIVALVSLLHAKPAETAEDIMRVLADERGLAEVPLQSRLALAGRCIQAFGVTSTDLAPRALTTIQSILGATRGLIRHRPDEVIDGLIGLLIQSRVEVGGDKGRHHKASRLHSNATLALRNSPPKIAVAAN
jgi:hypothetical protein